MARVEPFAEIKEPAVFLAPMTAGNEVVEDYGHVGLTLRQHPVTFLRTDLQARHILTCADAMNAKDGPVADKLADFSEKLATVGSRDGAFPLEHGPGEGVAHGGGRDLREMAPKGFRARDLYDPRQHLDTIKLKTRDFH